MGLRVLFKQLDEVQTCDTSRARQILWRLFRLNTILLVINCIFLYSSVHDEMNSKDGSTGLGLTIALYAPSLVMLLIDEVLYGMTATNPTLMLLRVSTVSSALAAFVTVAAKAARFEMHMAGGAMGSSSSSTRYRELVTRSVSSSASHMPQSRKR